MYAHGNEPFRRVSVAAVGYNGGVHGRAAIRRIFFFSVAIRVTLASNTSAVFETAVSGRRRVHRAGAGRFCVSYRVRYVDG